MPTRVSHLSLFDRTAFNILQDYERYTRQQALVSSGKSILLPSDNPSGMAQALQMRTAINFNEQFQRNIDYAHGWITYSDQQLDSVVKGLQAVRAKVISVSNDVNAPAGSQPREAAAQVVDAVLEEMLTYANAQYESRFLFAGFKTSTRPFTATRNATNEITAVTYNGNTATPPPERIFREISETERVHINCDGRDLFVNTDGTTGTTDPTEKIFTELIRLRDDLRSNKPIGNPATPPPYTYPVGPPFSNLNFISQHLTALTNIIDRVDLCRAELGENAARLTRTRELYQKQQANMKAALSNIEDLDMSKGALQLTNQLNQYQAAINAGSKIVTPGLMNFLK